MAVSIQVWGMGIQSSRPVFASLDLSADTDSVIYTATEPTMLTVNITNRSGSSQITRLAVSPSATLDSAGAIAYDLELLGLGVLEREGIVLDTGESCVARTTEIRIAGVWSSLPTTQRAYQTRSVGDSDSAFYVGGYLDSNSYYTNNQTWNGTSWVFEPGLSQQRADHAVVGTVAGNSIVFGGLSGNLGGFFPDLDPTDDVEIRNNDFWNTAAFDQQLPQPRDRHGGFGSFGSATAAGGRVNFDPDNTTVQYTGTGWVASASFSQAREYHGTSGTDSSAFVSGGDGAASSMETWNGIAWSSAPNLLSSRTRHAASGTADAALIFGGTTEGAFPGTGPYYSSSEEYNGISWISGGAMSQSRRNHAGSGSQGGSIAISGLNPDARPAVLDTAEIYTK